MMHEAFAMLRDAAGNPRTDQGRVHGYRATWSAADAAFFLAGDDGAVFAWARGWLGAVRLAREKLFGRESGQ